MTMVDPFILYTRLYGFTALLKNMKCFTYCIQYKYVTDDTIYMYTNISCKIFYIFISWIHDNFSQVTHKVVRNNI